MNLVCFEAEKLIFQGRFKVQEQTLEFGSENGMANFTSL